MVKLFGRLERRWFLLASANVFLGGTLAAQTTAGVPAGAAASPAGAPVAVIHSRDGWPKPSASDVDSVEHVVASLYDVISGPAHQPRNWDRMRSLFLPGARLIPVRIVPGPANEKVLPSTDVVFLTIDDYIKRASPVMEAEGFYEHSVHNETAAFGNIVSVFSTYESRHALDDAKPFARGINSIQLMKDGDRYWIVDVYWDSEREGSVIAPRYLPSAAGSVQGSSRGFTGDWTGQLEYRDYGTEERVFLPTWLTMEPLGEGRVRLKYVYDDGPNKVVREESVLTWDAAAKRATVSSAGDGATAVYSVDGLEEFSQRACGRLTFTGKGTENNQPVDVQIVLTLERNLFTWVKSTRPAGSGDPFRFRDGYTMTRSTAPAF